MEVPPLFSALASAGADPVTAAIAAAREGCDAGLVVFDSAADRLRAAVVLAPEVPLAQAAVMLPLFGIGLQNAFGALAPPEIAVQLGWDGGLSLNGARCGALALWAAPRDPGLVPDWLVVGLDLALWDGADETGRTPDTTTLAAEGCGEVTPDILLPAWLRHSLVWLNTWETDGTAPLLKEWTGLAHGIGAETVATGRTGRALGVDERFGLVLRQENHTVLVPLSDLVKGATT